jgi:hypothetical protein
VQLFEHSLDALAMKNFHAHGRLEMAKIELDLPAIIPPKRSLSLGVAAYTWLHPE